jgi:hypothetical protein
MDRPASPSCSTCGAWWRLPLLLALVLAAILLTRGRNVRETAPETVTGQATPQQAAASAEHLSLAIDFGDGRREEFGGIVWHKGMTIRDALQQAPEVTIGQQGTGASAFLTQINGVANDGATGRNWTYTVNGRRGDRSFALYELQPEDQVLWSFAPTQ